MPFMGARACLVRSEINSRSCSASAALNKWLKTKIGQGYTIHSFRHSMRDRLRAVECPSDVIDQIGGWLAQGVGNSYGNGYDYNTLNKWMISLIGT